MTACFLYESIPYKARQKGGGGSEQRHHPQKIEREVIGRGRGEKNLLTFDSRVVLFDEMALDKPNGQSGLAHSYPAHKNMRGDSVRTSSTRTRIGREREGGGTPLTTATDENELVFA